MGGGPWVSQSQLSCSNLTILPCSSWRVVGWGKRYAKDCLRLLSLALVKASLAVGWLQDCEGTRVAWSQLFTHAAQLCRALCGCCWRSWLRFRPRSYRIAMRALQRGWLPYFKPGPAHPVQDVGWNKILRFHKMATLIKVPFPLISVNGQLLRPLEEGKEFKIKSKSGIMWS